MTPSIAVALGDPRGIGPEMVAAALERDDLPVFRPLIYGPEGYAAELEPRARARDGCYVVVAPGGRHSNLDEAGRAARAALEAAVAAALQGEAAALMTAPVDKRALHAAGITAPGQTEWLQQRCGVADVGMAMVAERTLLGEPLRLLLATTHLPLRSVADALTPERLVDQTRLLGRALRELFGFPAPRLALCALNPHASDGGLFGDEEARVYAPAIATLRAEGWNVSDPLSADTVFLRTLRGEFDAVIVPYHDVGMAVFKTIAFADGVNLTLGLPFPRTAPAHGTAFDLVGTGRADPGPTVAALRLAAALATRRFDRDRRRL